MITKSLTLGIVLTLPACTSGSHVEQIQVMTTKYSCSFSPNRWTADRRIALCESEAECNKVCEENRKKEGF